MAFDWREIKAKFSEIDWSNWREELRENPIIMQSIAIIAIVGASIAIIVQLTPSSATLEREGYFYDLNTGELFAAPLNATPPIQSPTDSAGGLNGAKAYVFTCSDCDDEQFIAYLKKFPEDMLDEIAAQQEEIEIPQDDFMEILALVRKPDGDEWYSEDSPEAEQIFEDLRNRCPETIRACYPD
jgi:hypothetical protein